MTVSAAGRAPGWFVVVVLAAALVLVAPAGAGAPTTAPTAEGAASVTAPDDTVVTDTSSPAETTSPPVEGTGPPVEGTGPPVEGTSPPVEGTGLVGVAPELVDEDLPGTGPPAVLVWGLALSLAVAAMIAVFFVRSRRGAARNSGD